MRIACPTFKEISCRNERREMASVSCDPNLIVFTILTLTEFGLVPNQPQNYKHKLIPFDLSVRIILLDYAAQTGKNGVGCPRDE